MKFLLTLSAVALALASSSAEAASCSSLYGQCGGIGFSGATCCASGSTCVYQNDYYSQCLPGSAASSSTTTKTTTTTVKITTTTKAPTTTTTTTTKSTTTTTKSTATASPTVESSTCADIWGQCGGNGWSGATCCPSGSTCVPQNGNQYYSQCIPNSSITASASSTTTTKAATTTKATTNAVSTTTTTKVTTTKTTTTSAAATTTPATSANYSVISGGASGSGTTTRYWDCCKASCSWPGKASVSAPVDTCGANGISLLDDNAVSGCNGGNGFMCNNNQPWAVNDNLAYGFAAASIAGSSEAGWCCGCYEVTFTSTAVAGKKMVVQVTNTGGDLGSNHFDLQIPGGGVGIFNGCSAQWGAPSDGWGARYGGVSDASACSSLPSALQDGCKWRFNWFKNADNPSMTFKEVTCPAELVARTGCQRN